MMEGYKFIASRNHQQCILGAGEGAAGWGEITKASLEACVGVTNRNREAHGVPEHHEMHYLPEYLSSAPFSENRHLHLTGEGNEGLSVDATTQHKPHAGAGTVCRQREQAWSFSCIVEGEVQMQTPFSLAHWASFSQGVLHRQESPAEKTLLSGGLSPICFLSHG